MLRMKARLCVVPGPYSVPDPKLVILGRLPCLNDLLDARRITKGKWNKYTELKREWGARIALFAKAQKMPKVTNGHFVYSFFEPNKRRDKSNILGGAVKLIEDGLVEAGVLENDGWKQIESIRGRYFVDAVRPRVELVVYCDYLTVDR